MYTISIIIGQQRHGLNVDPGNTPAQVLEYFKNAGVISRFQGQYSLQFNGRTLPAQEPLGHSGVGPGATLQVHSYTGPGFGGGGKESLLRNILNGFTKTK